MSKPILLLIISFASPNVFADFSKCLEVFPNNTPPKISIQYSNKLKELCFDSFAVLHSGDSKTPVYVVEKSNKDLLRKASKIERVDKFYEEARLPSSHRAKLSDYKGSGYDRGHMFPAANASSDNAMAQSFSLANMVPQNSELNRGIWAKNVEAATRKYISRAKGDVYIFTGPIYNGNINTIGPGKVWVPSAVFKLVYDQEERKSWVFVQDNNASSKMNKPINYNEFVQRTGLNLISQ